MKISYHRSGGRTPPRDNEHLEISEDGAFSLWRSIGWATQPPTPAGRFGGKLDASQNEQLQNEARSAAGVGDLEIMPRMDSSVEIITLEWEGADEPVRASLGIHDEPDGPWATLVIRLRTLLGTLTAFPQAAVALELLNGGNQARLVCTGKAAVHLDLTKLKVRAVLWVDGIPKGDWDAEEPHSENLAEVTVRPGWTLDLPFEHGFEVEKVGAGNRIAAYAEFEIIDDGWPIPVSVEAFS